MRAPDLRATVAMAPVEASPMEPRVAAKVRLSSGVIDTRCPVTAVVPAPTAVTPARPVHAGLPPEAACVHLQVGMYGCPSMPIINPDLSRRSRQGIDTTANSLNGLASLLRAASGARCLVANQKGGDYPWSTSGKREGIATDIDVSGTISSTATPSGCLQSSRVRVRRQPQTEQTSQP